MKKNEKYRITWEEQRQDGTWEKHDSIETQAFALLADHGGGQGVNAYFMNISNKDLALMIAHTPILRETVVEFLPQIMIASKLLDKLQKGEDELIDAEALLTRVESRADGKNADSAVMDENPRGLMERLRKKFKK